MPKPNEPQERKGSADLTEAFLRLYNQEQRNIYAYIRMLLFYQDDAEDIFQETCIALWQSFDQFSPGSDFGAWARQIARHRVLAHGKRRQRDRHVFSKEILDRLSDHAEQKMDVIESQQIALDQCIEKLSDTDRDMVCCRYRYNMTTIELAEKFERPLSTIYKSLKRIRTTLSKCVRLTLRQEEGLI